MLKIINFLYNSFENVPAKLPRMETIGHNLRRQCALHAAYPPVLEDGNILSNFPRFTVKSNGDEFLNMITRGQTEPESLAQEEV